MSKRRRRRRPPSGNAVAKKSLRQQVRELRGVISGERPTPDGHRLRQREKILIGVPAEGMNLGIGVEKLLTAAWKSNLDEHCPWHFDWVIKNDVRPVEYARNHLVKEFFLRPDYDRLWMIDNDMIAPPNALQQLLVDADIVVAHAVNFNHRTDTRLEGIKLCAFDYNEDRHAFTPLDLKPGMESSIVDIKGGGTGSMVITRRVLEDPRMHLDPSYTGLHGLPSSLIEESHDDSWAPAVFRTLYKPNGEVLRGEDLDFTRRAYLLGYSMKCHLGVRFGHFKRIDLNQSINLINRVAREVERDALKVVQFRKGEGNAEETHPVD